MVIIELFIGVFIIIAFIFLVYGLKKNTSESIQDVNIEEKTKINNVGDMYTPSQEDILEETPDGYIEEHNQDVINLDVIEEYISEGDEGDDINVISNSI